MKIFTLNQIEKIDNQQLYKYSKLVGSNARKWKNQFVALLPEIAKRGIYKKDFATITEFAKKIGGIGENTVKEIFRIQKYIEDKPELKELVGEVGVHKVRVVATIATKENQKDLVKKVKTMKKSTLEEFARNKRNKLDEAVISKVADSNNNTLFGQKNPGMDREFLGFHVDKKTALEFRKFKQKMEKEKKEKVEFNEVLGTLLEIAKEEPKMVKERKQREHNSRPAPVAKKREAEEKYNGCCAFPGCNKPATQLHHPDRYALNKSHKRIVPMCDIHHDIAHNGLIGNEHLEPEAWYIREKADKNHPKFKIDQKVIQYKMAACST